MEEQFIPNPNSNFETANINNHVKSKIIYNKLFSLHTVTNGDVFKYHTYLDIYKSTRTDYTRILKVSNSIIEDSLTHIINPSLCTSIF